VVPLDENGGLREEWIPAQSKSAVRENDENATQRRRKPAKERRVEQALPSIGDGAQLCRVAGVEDEE